MTDKAPGAAVIKPWQDRLGKSAPYEHHRFAMMDEIADLRAALKTQSAPTEAQGDLRERVIAAVEAERVDDTGTDGDTAYNSAIDHCIEAVNGLFTPAQIAVQGEDSARLDAERYRHLRAGLQGGAYPQDGSVWVVRYKHPKGAIPELQSAGIGEELDRNVDAARASAETGGVKS